MQVGYNSSRGSALFLAQAPAYARNPAYCFNADEAGADFTRNLLRRKMSSYSSWDLQYNYLHDWSNAALGNTGFSLGILDAFNEDLPS